MGVTEFMRPKFPIVGISTADIVTALAVVDSSPEVTEKRVLMVEVRQDGHLLVQTGMQSKTLAGSGKMILLRHTDTGWEIVEVTTWRS